MKIIIASFIIGVALCYTSSVYPQSSTIIISCLVGGLGGILFAIFGLRDEEE